MQKLKVHKFKGKVFKANWQIERKLLNYQNYENYKAMKFKNRSGKPQREIRNSFFNFLSYCPKCFCSLWIALNAFEWCELFLLNGFCLSVQTGWKQGSVKCTILKKIGKSHLKDFQEFLQVSLFCGIKSKEQNQQNIEFEDKESF